MASQQQYGERREAIAYTSVSQTVRRDSLGRDGIMSGEAGKKKTRKTEKKKLKIPIFYLTNFLTKISTLLIFIFYY
jgi:hypothetical protein